MNRRHYIDKTIIESASRGMSREQAGRALKAARGIDPLLVIIAIAAALCLGCGLWLLYNT